MAKSRPSSATATSAAPSTSPTDSSGAFVELVVGELGRVDILVNNGLALGRTEIADGSDEDDAIMSRRTSSGSCA